MINGEHIRRLLASNDNLHTWHGYPGQAITSQLLLQRATMQEEEVEELVAALTEGLSLEEVAEAAVDILYVALGTLMILPSSVADEAVERVIAKNAQKTTETHYLAEDGKIRPKLSDDDSEESVADRHELG